MSESFYEIGAWIYKIFITLIVAIIVIAIAGSTVQTNLNTHNIQKQLLLNRILYSPDGFWYEHNGVTMPGIVDKQKFNQQQMDRNFAYPTNYGGARIVLVQGGSEEDIFIEETTFTQFRNQFVERFSGGGYAETHTYPVLVRQGEETSNGYLIIQIAVPEQT